MTEKQVALLQFLRDRAAVSEVAPSLEEMRLALGLKAKSGAHRLVASLEEQGKIRRRQQRARAIELVEASSFDGISNATLMAECRRRGLAVYLADGRPHA